MEIIIANSGVSIGGVDNFKEFSVSLETSPFAAQGQLSAHNAGRLVDDQHVAVDIDFIRKAVGDIAATAEWQSGYQAMIDYARKKSWLTDDETAILGHIVWRNTATETGNTVHINTRRHRVAIIGLGSQGRGIAKLVEQIGHEIVGGVDIGEIVGRPLSQVIDGCVSDVLITPSIGAMLASQKAPIDVAILAAAVDFDMVLSMTGELLDHGINVLCLHQDLFSFDPSWTPALHARAVKGGASVMGCGVQDIWWVQLITLAASSVIGIKKITLIETVSLEALSAGIGKEIGVPLSHADFEAHVEETAAYPSVIGAPLVEAVRRMGAKSGPLTKTVVPIFKDTQYKWIAGGMILQTDKTQGMEERVCFTTDHGFSVEGVIAVVPGAEADAKSEVHIDGTPSLKLSFGPITKDVTNIALVSRLSDVMDAAPGVIFSADLPPPQHQFLAR